MSSYACDTKRSKNWTAYMAWLNLSLAILSNRAELSPGSYAASRSAFGGTTLKTILSPSRSAWIFLQLCISLMSRCKI